MPAENIRRFLRTVVRDPEWALQRLGVIGLLGRNRYGGAPLERIHPEAPPRSVGPLVDPTAIPASDATALADADVILGIAEGNEARAYPWRFLEEPHIANDVVGGRPVALVLCPICSSAVGLDPLVDGQRLVFDPNYVYNGNIAAQDRQTGSVWAPLRAEAIRGRLRGRRLELVAVWQMDWATWRSRHPDTTVVLSGFDRLSHPPGHGGLPRRFLEGLAHWDERLPYATMVLGVIIEDRVRAFPLESTWGQGGVLNDELAGRPIVVLADASRRSFAAAAFYRSVDGGTLTFRPSPEGALDEETGSRWTFDGRAVDGPLSGHQLEFAPSIVAEWYGLATNHANIEIAEAGSRGG